MSIYRQVELGYILEPYPDEFTRALNARWLKKKLNSILKITGNRGDGKSYTAMFIKLVRELEQGFEFDLDRFMSDICFSVKNVFLRMDYYKDNGIKFPWIILDEAGLNVPAREFMKQANLVVSQAAQSSRSGCRPNVIVVVPHNTMVDLHLQMLADFWLHMKGRYHARVYYNQMKVWGTGVKTPICTDFEVGELPKKIGDEYEDRREEELAEWRKKSVGKLKYEENKTVSFEKIEQEAELVERAYQLHREGKLKEREISGFLKAKGVEHNRANTYRNKIVYRVLDEKGKEGDDADDANVENAQ